MTKAQLRKIVAENSIEELSIDDIYELKSKPLRDKLEKALIKWEYAAQECDHLESVMYDTEEHIKKLLGIK